MNKSVYRNKKSDKSNLTAYLYRGSQIESIHRVHAVISDTKGRVLLYSGDPDYLTFIRSALKPFQALPFVSSGAADQINVANAVSQYPAHHILVVQCTLEKLLRFYGVRILM